MLWQQLNDIGQPVDLYDSMLRDFVHAQEDREYIVKACRSEPVCVLIMKW